MCWKSSVAADESHVCPFKNLASSTLEAALYFTCYPKLNMFLQKKMTKRGAKKVHGDWEA